MKKKKTQVKAHLRKTKKGKVPVRTHKRKYGVRVKEYYSPEHKGVDAVFFFGSKKDQKKGEESLKKKYPDRKIELVNRGSRGCPYCKGDPNKVCPVCETKERPWMGPFKIRSSGSGLGDRMKAEEHLFNLNKELRKKTDALGKLTDGDPLKQEKLVKEIRILKKRIDAFVGVDIK